MLVNFAKIAFCIGFFVLGLVPLLAILERRFSAFMQGRIGPDRVNLPFVGRLGGVLPGGLGQPLAENNRLPFDLPECEAELVGGYHTEYSSIKFALFMMGEYVGMVLMSSLLVTFFLGGWHFPGITDPSASSVGAGILSFGVFLAKLMALLTLYILIRWTLPRFKYNQLMNLGWKVLVPISLANVLVVAVIGVLTGRVR